MLITKRLRKMDAVLDTFQEQGRVYLLFSDVDAQVARIKDLGFSVPFVAGESLLPDAKFGRGARRNANGYELIHRDQPKEIRYHQIEWTWTERHGPDLVERTGIKDRPYYRYPRTAVLPFSVELKLHKQNDDAHSIMAGPFNLTEQDAIASLQNAIHMFVELFGHCRVVANIDDIPAVRTRQLNWEILPVGKRPWEETERALQRLIERSKPNEQPVLQARFDEILAYHPDLIATGRGGFARYVVHGWTKQHVYLLESMQVNNATYVLNEDWEAVSKATKAEILHADAHEARLIHREQWFDELRQFMEQNRIYRADEGEAA